MKKLPSNCNPKNPLVRDIEVQVLKDHMNYGLLIDVREESEFETLNKIPIARHIPLDTLLETPLEELGLNKDKPLIFICRSGGRSARAAAYAAAQDFEAYNLAGGMLAWDEAKV